MKKIRLKYFFLTIIFGFTICKSSFAQSNKAIDSLMNVLKTAIEDTNKVNTLIELSIQLTQRSTFEDAKKYANEALALAKTLNFKKGIIYAYYRIGQTYSRNANIIEAIKNYKASLRISEEIGDKSEMANGYNLLGRAYTRLGNYPEALKNHFHELSLAKEIGNKRKIAHAYNNIGIIYYEQGDYTEGLKYHLAALKIREELNDKDGVSASNTNIGLIYLNQGSYLEALDNFQVSLKIEQEKGNTPYILNTYINIAEVYKRQENYTELLKTHYEMLKIGEESGNKSYKALVTANFAYFSSSQGNYSEALKNFQASLKLYEELKNKRGIASSYEGIGHIFEKQGNYFEALNNFIPALNLYKELGFNEESEECYRAIAFCNIKMNKPEQSKKYLDTALALAKEMKSKLWIEIIYHELAGVDSVRGNFQSALENYKLAAFYRDSLFKETRGKEITQLQEQYESEKKDKDILQLTSDKQKLESERQINSLLLKNKQDSLLIVQAEKEKVELENDKVNLENERAEALNLYNEQQIELLGNEKRLQQLQIEKDKADITLQKAEADKKQEQLLVLGKEKDIQSLQLKKQKEAKNYFIAGLSLLAMLSFFIFRNFQNQRKLNKLYKISAEKQMAELQLQSLRAQLNPHFMFNSLNAIQELIVMEENEKSQSYLERFAQLLRQLLENANQPFIPLRKEIGFLELYLSLEKLRLPDLKYSIEVDPKLNAENLVIPNMMLQPYIENALWHGLQHKQGEKKLQLHISRQNGTLQYEIRDNGVGRKKAEEMKTLYRKEHRSKGMELLSQRFDLLSQEYGQTIQTKVTDLVENGNALGTLVEISVPVSLSEQEI